MARKLKRVESGEVVGLHLFPANPDVPKGQKTRTRSSFTAIIKRSKRVDVVEFDLAYSEAMALCHLAAQRIISGDGWVHSEKLCTIRAGDEATKLICKMRKNISHATDAYIEIENNLDKSYALGIDAGRIKFDVTNLAACDDAVVVALIKMAAMKRPEAVNGNTCSTEVDSTGRK